VTRDLLDVRCDWSTISDISEKMLYQQLRQLEADGLVRRTAYPEVPPRVEYASTPRSRPLVPVLNEVSAWAAQHLSDRLASPRTDEAALEKITRGTQFSP